MIIVIHGSPRRWFGYWQKPVTGRLGRSGQNNRFCAVIGTRDWFAPSPQRYEKSFQDENSRMIVDLHTPELIQIPIVFRHTEIPCLRLAVSSLGACPTPAL